MSLAIKSIDNSSSSSERAGLPNSDFRLRLGTNGLLRALANLSEGIAPIAGRSNRFFLEEDEICLGSLINLALGGQGSLDSNIF